MCGAGSSAADHRCERDADHLVLSGAAIAIDGTTLFPAGHDLVARHPRGAADAENRVDPGGAFATQSATVPGSRANGRRRDRLGADRGLPLLMFSIGGMLCSRGQRPAADVHRARGALPAVVLLCGLARRRRLLSQEAAMKYFLLGAFSSAFFLYGRGHALRLRGFGAPVRHLRRGLRQRGNDALLLIGMALLGVRPCCSRSVRCRSRLDPGRLPGRADPDHRVHGRGHQGVAFGALMRVYYVALGGAKWTGTDDLGRRHRHHDLRCAGRDRQTDVKRMLAYSSIAHAGFILVGLSATSQKGLSATLFYLATMASPRWPRSPSSAWCADGGGEATHCRSGRLGGARGGGGHLRVAPAGLRRDPADQRFRREVRGVLGGRVGRGHPTGRGRCAVQRDRRVLSTSG